MRPAPRPTSGNASEGGGAVVDIVIPVYNEGQNIRPVLESLRARVRAPFRVLLCYDRDDDDTLPAARALEGSGLDLRLVKNRGKGPLAAVLSGFAESTAPAALAYMADDDFNAPIVDAMVERFRQGCDVVAASRFMDGGSMTGCPRLKAVLVRGAAFCLHYLARLPTHDPTNGFRLFSRRVLREIPVESTKGFAYSLELTVKCHRRGWRIGEVPAAWRERSKGASRFRLWGWLPTYLRWFFYAFSTTYIRGAGSRGYGILLAPGVTAGCLAAITFFFCPRFALWKGLGVPESWHNPEVNRAVDALAQLRHPLARIANPSNKVLRWRLLFPGLFHALGLPPRLYLATPLIGCALTLGFLVRLALAETGDWLYAAVAGIVLGATPWLFVSEGWLAYFDSWYMLGLLAVAFVPSRAALAAACALTPWIDERFVLGVPLCLLIRWIVTAEPGGGAPRERRLDAAAVLAPLVPYILFRGAVLVFGADADSRSYLAGAARSIPAATVLARGAWQGLRGAWLFFGAFLYLSTDRGKFARNAALAATAAATIAADLLIAGDVGRSMSALVPAAAAGILLWSRRDWKSARIALVAAMALDLASPAEHVMATWSLPISPLYAELERCRNPPFYLNAAAYTLRGLGRVRRGNRRGAFDDFTTAARLEPGYAYAYYYRGLLRRDAGDAAAAREDFRRALAAAPPDWRFRRQAEAWSRAEGGR